MNPKKRKKLAVLKAKEEVAAVVETVPEVKVELKEQEVEQVAVEETPVESATPVPAVKKSKKSV